MSTVPPRRRMRALVTRPRDEAASLAAALTARGFEPVVEPLIDIVEYDRPPPDLDGVQAILCTSANGVRALARHLGDRGVPIFAVGDATAARARAAGFRRVESADGTVDDLARLAGARLDPRGGRLLHIAGSAVAGDLAGRLAAAGFATERIVLYEARPAAALTAPTAALIGGGKIDLALFFSPRTAAIFVRLVEAAGIGDGLRAALALSISGAADAALGDVPFHRRRIAGAPTQAALLDLVDRQILRALRMSEPEPSPELPAVPPPAPRHAPRWAIAAAAGAVVVVALLAATPFWAPAVVTLLPWGPHPALPAPAAKPEADLTPKIAALDAAAARQTEATQRLDQRIAAIEARPAADLAPLRQQLAALSERSVDVAQVRQQLAAQTDKITDLTSRLGAIDKQVHAEAANDPGSIGLVLVLLQIREAVEVARPFAPEYDTLVALARRYPDIAAAAAPLAEPAVAGVASRAALAERLRQLAPQIATATPPATDPGWTARIKTELRSLVSVRRIDGAGQGPAEVAVATAQRDLAAGDLAGAAAALGSLTGANAAAAQPWLAMAGQRLQVETALRRIAGLATAQLGAATAAPAETAR